MRGERRSWVSVAAATVAAVVLALCPPVLASAPARSGTILGGTGVELAGGQPWEQPAAERSGCAYAVDCLAWLHSGCAPALAGHDPVLTASIVDVRQLADGRTPRTFHLVAPSVPPWGLFPGAVVQLWRQDCTEITAAKLHTIGSDSTCERYEGTRCSFTIPTDATWMTVSGYVTTVKLTWTLA